MAKVDVVNLSGKKVGTVDLADAVFAPEQVNEALLWEAVKHYRASLRQGTAATKNRKLVAGSGKKLWKQKGTGRARVGSVRSPLWRHGGTVHGPQPRSYEYPFPRKKLLRRAALGAGCEAGRRQADRGRFARDQGRQNQALPRGVGQARRQADGAVGRKRQDAGADRWCWARATCKGVELVLNNEVHPYDLLRYERAIFSKAAIEQLGETLEKSTSKRKHEARKTAAEKEAV